MGVSLQAVRDDYQTRVVDFVPVQVEEVVIRSVEAFAPERPGRYMPQQSRVNCFQVMMKQEGGSAVGQFQIYDFRFSIFGLLRDTDQHIN